MSLKTLKTISRSSILTNFLHRESLSKTIPYNSSLPNPFSHTKSLGSNSSTAPRYSLRRQKKLHQLIHLEGLSPSILPPPSTHFLPKSITASSTTKSVKKVFHSVSHIPKTAILANLDLERKGPYVGRKVTFKGKLWERKKSERVEELRIALAGAELKEKIWRQGKKDEKKKLRPSLPF